MRNFRDKFSKCKNLFDHLKKSRPEWHKNVFDKFIQCNLFNMRIPFANNIQ